MAALREFQGRSSSLRLRGRRHAAVLVCGVLLAACGSTPSTTSSPTTGSPAPTPAAPGSAGPTSSTPGLPAGATWVAAGELETPRMAPRLVVLGDGRVMAVGNDIDCVAAFPGAPGDSDIAELWDAGTGTWTKTASLNALRAKNAALALADGRVLVAGGATEGRWDKHADKVGFQSYSSSWIFDPQAASWAKTDLMHAARTDAASAVLPDGRVLVAGGYFADLVDVNDYPWLVGGRTGPDVAGGRRVGGAAVTASWSARGPLADVAPPQPPAKVLATAELFDPATGQWSLTGPLAVPRFGASAVTLTDGRVLVAGEDATGVQGYDVYVDTGQIGENVGEVYDPRTGRFRVTGEYPGQAGETSVAGGVLVALGDGGALMVGGYDGDGMPAARTLRYDPASNAWTESGRLGTARAHAVAALRPDGTVIVAGGEDAYGPTASVELFDPANGTWSPAASMPQPRIGGAAAVLPDGSVLVAGGYAAHSHRSGDFLCPPALAPAVRLVPAR